MGREVELAVEAAVAEARAYGRTARAYGQTSELIAQVAARAAIVDILDRVLADNTFSNFTGDRFVYVDVLERLCEDARR